MITVLSGINTYAVSEALDKIKLEFTQKNDTAGVENYSGSQLEPGSLASLLGGATLFASERLVIIRDLSANKVVAEQLLEVLKKIPNEVHVVLVEPQLDRRTVFYKTLKKEVDFREFAELEEPGLSKWIAQYTESHGGKISSSTARVLTEYVGNNQSQLSNELDKLTTFNLEITPESIAELVEKRPEDTVFQLLDSALGNQQIKALGILDSLETAHEDPFQIANMLIWQVHILIVVQNAGSTPDGEIAKAAKINPFVVRKTKGLIAKLNMQRIRQITNTVARLDTTLKTTSVDPWRAIEQTILSF